ncbi:hypothetical protein L7A47_31545, partial [Achromobacter xylosoxidans]|uniref:hypothetical protein n=1 Tax=Alcaligenes xylosoxydans xylosoxydans TaxID=85698 RepID=UPI001F0F3F77
DLLWRDASQVEPLSRSWNMPRYWRLPESSVRDAAEPGRERAPTARAPQGRRRVERVAAAGHARGKMFPQGARQGFRVEAGQVPQHWRAVALWWDIRWARRRRRGHGDLQGSGPARSVARRATLH